MSAYVQNGQSGGYNYVCDGVGGYSFRVFDQVHRSFNIYSMYLDSYSASNPPLGGFCPQTDQSSDSRHGYLATTPSTWALSLPVTITDPSGTAYLFPGNPGMSGIPGVPLTLSTGNSGR